MACEENGVAVVAHVAWLAGRGVIAAKLAGCEPASLAACHHVAAMVRMRVSSEDQLTPRASCSSGLDSVA